MRKRMEIEYSSPAILRDICIEMEQRVLAASNQDVDENFDHVDTMGQEVGGTVNSNQWNSEWK